MATALAEALDRAIEIRRNGHQLDEWEAHCRVREMYNWYDIAERTEKVFTDKLLVTVSPYIVTGV